MKRIAAMLAIAALAPGMLFAAPAPPRPIAIVINGDTLPLNPPPRLVKNLLFVPVRRTIEALGLDFDRSGNRVVTQIGSKTVTLTVGSRVAYIDDEQVMLDAPTVEIKSVLYAPLRFFTDVLGAQAHFDRRANAVAIVAQLVGRSGDGLIAQGTGYERLGEVAAVDVLSDPPTVTLQYNGGVKTIPVAPNAIVDVQDVDANVTTPGELGDVRPGDFAQVEMRKDGRVERIVDAFGSHAGRIAAVAGNQFVLDDGQVIAAGPTTEVSLNGAAASFGALQPGDRASVRYNVETGEVREVLANRSVAVAPPAAGASAGPRIASVSSDATRPLRQGDSVTVTLRGTPGGSATFDIGSYVTNLAMHESPSGVYTASYTIPPGANFDEVPLIGHLAIATAEAAGVQAPETISASSTPPGITDFAPGSGATVNSDRPAIYATFSSDAVPVNPSSATLLVNGRDVTSDCVRTQQFIQYLPSYSYPDGPVHVTVRVADGAGNTSAKSWTFTIRTR